MYIYVCMYVYSHIVNASASCVHLYISISMYVSISLTPWHLIQASPYKCGLVHARGNLNPELNPELNPPP